MGRGELPRQHNTPAQSSRTTTRPVDDLGDGITATRLIPDLHIIPGLWKIDGYSKTKASLLQRAGLEENKNYFDFPYDWRRDNRVSGRRLGEAARGWLKAWRTSSGNENAKLVLIGHSMGGIVARYFLEVLEGWRDTRSLITFGTPYRGSLNAVGYLANGYAKGIGPLKVDLSETVRSFTAIYQLLPTFKCIDKGDGAVVRVGETSGLPNIDAARAAKALAFHQRNSSTPRNATPRTRPIAVTATRSFPLWVSNNQLSSQRYCATASSSSAKALKAR